MSGGMKLLLGVSLVLNVFLLGAAASAAFFGKRWIHEHNQLGQPSPLTIAARSLDPAAHETLTLTPDQRAKLAPALKGRPPKPAVMRMPRRRRRSSKSCSTRKAERRL